MEIDYEEDGEGTDIDPQENTREVLQQHESDGVCLVVELHDDDQDHQNLLSRDDVEPEEVDRSLFQRAKNFRPRYDDAEVISEEEEDIEEDTCDEEEEDFEEEDDDEEDNDDKEEEDDEEDEDEEDNDDKEEEDDQD